MISIIIPALNEAEQIESTLSPLQAMRQRGVEVILVDGGSEDETVHLAEPWVDQLIHSDRGRARQMNRGAAVAKGEILWFLHADTVVEESADQEVLKGAVAADWGRFDVRMSRPHGLLKMVAKMMNWRSCWSGIATGDQAIFVTRKRFQQIGGVPQIPLMEDIELSRQLKREGPPCCISSTLVTTSSRRWEARGVVRTVVLMWWLRFAYWVGISPRQIAAWYR